MSLPPPYAHQERTDAGIRAACASGATKVCVVMPTGSGKTYVGSRVIEGGLGKGNRAVWLTHREELVDQASRSLARLGVDHGVVKAGRATSPLWPIQIASIQTLYARPEALPPGDIIVVDETHHVVARTWRAVFERWNAPKLVLGLTATPERADRQPLGVRSGGVFEAMVAVTSIAELQQAPRDPADPGGPTILVPCRVRGPSAFQRELCRDPIDALVEVARRPDGTWRPAVLFAASVAHAAKLAERARALGMRAAHVDGTMRPDERRARIEAFDAGELDLITNMLVLTEGWDSPRVEVCILARACSSAATLLQIVGRVLRSCPETGKQRALLYDLCGSVWLHGLPDEDRRYSLDGVAIERAERIALKQCPACGSVFRAGPTNCLECGKPLARDLRVTGRVRLADVIDITEAAGPHARDGRVERRAFFDRLVDEQRTNQHDPKWIGVRWKERYGAWPPWPLPKMGEVAS